MMSQEEVRNLFDYKDGNLLWKKNPRGRKSTDPVAGTLNRSGYVVITVDGKKLHAHRLIWTYFNGWPEKWIDHINLDSTDNRIENLRLCERHSNCQNSKTRTDNTSGVKGLSWSSAYGKWVMQIHANGKKYSKLFFDFEEAKEFTEFVREIVHGEFAHAGGSV